MAFLLIVSVSVAQDTPLPGMQTPSSSSSSRSASAASREAAPAGSAPRPTGKQQQRAPTPLQSTEPQEQDSSGANASKDNPLPGMSRSARGPTAQDSLSAPVRQPWPQQPSPGPLQPTGTQKDSGQGDRSSEEWGWVQTDKSPQSQAAFAQRQQEKAAGRPEEGQQVAADVQSAYSSHSEVCGFHCRGVEGNLAPPDKPAYQLIMMHQYAKLDIVLNMNLLADIWHMPLLKPSLNQSLIIVLQLLSCFRAENFLRFGCCR